MGSVWRPWSRRSVPLNTQLGGPVTGFSIHSLKTASAIPEMLPLAADTRERTSAGGGGWAAVCSLSSPSVSTRAAAVATARDDMSIILA